MAQSITPLHSRPDPELKELYTLISLIILTSFHVFRVQICQSQRRFSGTKPRCGIPNASLLLPWLHAGGSPSVELGVVDGTVNGGP